MADLRLKGPIPFDRLVDQGPRPAAAKVQISLRGGGQAQAPPTSAKAGHQPILPAPVRTRGDRPPPEGQSPQGGRRSAFAVRGGGEKRTHHYLFIEFRAWLQQIRWL